LSEIEICSFDLPTFFLFREGDTRDAASSSTLGLVKTEPLSLRTDAYDFSYASDVVEKQ
jgi:hypothetical protein